jgi:iron complex outermembrane receptor protein
MSKNQIVIPMALAFTASVSLAQTATPPAEDQGQIDEIIVTAQKRSERLQDVPIAISVIDPALLESTNSRNLTELQGAVPSVFFAGNSGGGRTYITLRGATGLALNTGDEPVAIYMDDVYLARGVTIGMADLLDVGSIEIVRGPQGTLQGRNATAGAILLRSADPTDTFQGRVSGSYSDPEEFRSQLSLSGPLGNSGLKGRLALGYVDERGWATNTFNDTPLGGAQSLQSRGVLTYAGDIFSARLVGDWSRVKNNPAIFRYAATNFSALPTGALVPAGTATPNTPLPSAVRDEIFDHDRISLNPGSNTVVETGGVSARFGWSLGGMELVSITGARKADVSGTNDSDGLDTARMGYNHNDDQSKSVSQELRLQSAGDQRLSWILGTYYFREDQDYVDDIYNLQFTVPTNTVTQYAGEQVTKSYAAFADSTFKLTSKLSIIGGVRYTNDKKRLDARITPTNLTTGVTTNTPYAPPEEEWTDTSYRGKLVYQPNESLMLFAGYGKGFRAGGYNPFALQVPYAPETNKSAEIGAKGDALNRHFTYSVAAYRNKYANMQLRAGVPTGGAIITNAAESLIKGVEVELTARPISGLRIIANGAWTDAHFTSFPRARDTLDRQVDASGNRLPRTPKWQYFLATEKDFSVNGRWMLTAEANYRWRDEVVFFFTDQTAPTWQDPAGGELGARLTLRTDDEHWQASLFGINLTNERMTNTSGVTFSYPQIGLNKPRSVGISVQRQF